MMVLTVRMVTKEQEEAEEEEMVLKNVRTNAAVATMTLMQIRGKSVVTMI